MAKSHATEFYHTDDFFAIGEQYFKALKNRIDTKTALYKELCDSSAELLNSAGFHEKFTVNFDFIFNLATHAIEEASGVFLRSESGHQVFAQFSSDGKGGVNIELFLDKADEEGYMAKSQATEFYHADDFYPIGELFFKTQKNRVDERIDIYKEVCDISAEELNNAGLHEKFTVDFDFVFDLASQVVEEASGVFLRSESGYEVFIDFFIDKKDNVQFNWYLGKVDK